MKKQWCFENTGQEVNGVKGNRGIDINILPVLDDIHPQKEVIVGVIDSGIDFASAELKGALYVNSGEIVENGIDDDGNGYIDDINGWNFYDDTNVIYTDFTSDFHGTSIASVIAGKQSNNVMFGVFPEVKILPLKCFRGTKGDISNVILAIEYGYQLGVRIFNCSWDTTIYDEELYSVMKKYSDAVFVCSAGKMPADLNENPVYPASFQLSNIICVGGIDSCGTTYKYSGYGSVVDIYAPSESIYCVMPEQTYIYSEGTSLGTALVTGTIALLTSHVGDSKEINWKDMLDKCENEMLNVQTLFEILDKDR